MKAMATVRLEIVPWLTRNFGGLGLGRLVLEREVSEGQVLGKLLRDLAAQHQEFAKVAFDAALERPTRYVSLILNDRIVEWAEEWTTEVKDGDTLVLLPAYAGG